MDIRETLYDIKYYMYDKPMHFLSSIKHWFYCNFNKEHWRLVKSAFLSYGWDYDFILELEERQIDQQIRWFTNHQIMIDEQYKEIMRSLKWAKHCLHTMRNDHDLYVVKGEPEVYDTNNPNLKKVSMDSIQIIYTGPRVNWKNAHRFVNSHILNNEWFRTHDENLYVAKCKHLYYKIRKKYTETWWD